ncbi:winged helix-turn-helix domain-containing protein [uncultured Hydrogenophaga sp.]|uniref:winged helix-turn-helix domain-containing protein n=1 Tax=uncultured Hydrogenophaga sp. TaxID=199683 RepID=UPI00265E849E|nr:winged helix-turn-helix domain-containing protein [uncultured Hydrogenophaga sp.]
MVAKVSNPLTVIAIFAGVAEGFAAVALIQLPTEIQRTFVWFVMAFPILLVGAFFLTLITNSKVLYAPSDFTSDESYLAAHGFIEAGEKLKRELVEAKTKSPEQVRAYLDKVIASIDQTIQSALLSEREGEILQLLSNGPKTAAEIAEVIGTSRMTAAVHLSRMQEKGAVMPLRQGTTKVWTPVLRD